MRSEAYFSADRRYRYWLLRVWDDSLPIMANIGVNPSTADEVKNDSTVRKDIGFATRLGFGGLLKLNVGAFRSTDPKRWRKAFDPIGAENSAVHLWKYLGQFGVTQTVAAWGKNGNYFTGRCEAIRREIPDLWCFGKNSDGTPRHTLMLPYSTLLEPFPFSRTTGELWAISRMRRLFVIWDRGLDNSDKEFVLRRIRDKEPAIFWKIAQEHLRLP